jgi:hypothetical protein
MTDHTDKGEFFLSALVYHNAACFIFKFIGAYGPADHASNLPCLIGEENCDVP